MSLRDGLKAKFKPSKEEGEDLESDISLRRRKPVAFYRSKTDGDVSSSGSPLGSLTGSPSMDMDDSLLLDGLEYRTREDISPESEGRDDGGAGVFELQLSQLQEQLVATMIENQQLSTELASLKEAGTGGEVERRLEEEREDKRQLEQQLIRLQGHLGARGGQSGAPSSPTGRTPGSPPSSLPSRLRVRARGVWAELLLDLSETERDAQPETDDGEPLTVKRLKDNIRRFKYNIHPVMQTVKGVGAVRGWKTPSFTLMAFVLYVYAVWYGVLPHVVLLLGLTKLALNYTVTHWGWNVNVRFLHFQDHDQEPEESRDLGVSDKFTLVLQVARKVQNGLGDVSDALEKLNSLFMWENRQATRQLMTALVCAFLAVCLLPMETVITMAGVYLGVKLFVVDHLYSRYPRLRRKYDSAFRIWANLPTRAHLRSQRATALDRDLSLSHSPAGEPGTRLVLGCESPEPGSSGESPDAAPLSQDESEFCQVFTLPPAEAPLADWSGGRIALLINKEKPLTQAYKNGNLYLTKSYLCFERSKEASIRNLKIPLREIVRVIKAKQYSWLPGQGMSIEVTVAGSDKPYVFGALINRDECHTSILAQAARLDLSWARSS